MSGNRRYTIRFLSAMVGYSILIIVSSRLLDTPMPDVVRYLIAALPLLPLVVALHEVMVRIRTLDELERRVQLDGFAFSIGCTVAITMTLSMLERAGFPQLDLVWVPVMLIAFWGIGAALATRRYR